MKKSNLLLKFRSDDGKSCKMVVEEDFWFICKMEVTSAQWKDYHHQLYQVYHGFIALTLIPFALLFLEWDSGAEKVDSSSGSWFFVLFAHLW